VNDPVDRVILERRREDLGFSNGFFLSLGIHVVLVGGAFAAEWLMPKQPPLMVQEGFAVVLPRGGGGDPNAGGGRPAAPPSAPPATAPSAPPPEPEPPPKVIKPPKEEPRKGLAELDSKKKAPKKPEKPPAARPGAARDVRATAATGSQTGPGTANATPGLALAPPGVGVPTGTETGGDWYLAGVQQKIWMIWTQQIKAGFNQPIGVTFTILADGTVTDVQVTMASGATLLNLAAQRAVLNAAPFAPLPKDYGTTRFTIRAVFKPTT
jgi:protein TonB